MLFVSLSLYATAKQSHFYFHSSPPMTAFLSVVISHGMSEVFLQMIEDSGNKYELNYKADIFLILAKTQFGF